MGRVPQQREAPQNAQIELEYSSAESGKSSDIQASEMGGGAAVPYFLNDLGGPAAPPHFFLSCHWLLHIQFLSESELTWHDQISNYTARNWRFPGLSTISAITIETKKSLNESDCFRTPYSTHVEGVVGCSAAAF